MTSMTPADDRIINVTEGSPWRGIWQLSWPMLLMMVFNFLVGFTDVYVAGLVGPEVQARRRVCGADLFSGRDRCQRHQHRKRSRLISRAIGAKPDRSCRRGREAIPSARCYSVAGCDRLECCVVSTHHPHCGLLAGHSRYGGDLLPDIRLRPGTQLSPHHLRSSLSGRGRGQKTPDDDVCSERCQYRTGIRPCPGDRAFSEVGRARYRPGDSHCNSRGNSDEPGLPPGEFPMALCLYVVRQVVLANDPPHRSDWLARRLSSGGLESGGNHSVQYLEPAPGGKSCRPGRSVQRDANRSDHPFCRSLR